MSKFKVGDKVRRLDFPYDNIKIGTEGKIKRRGKIGSIFVVDVNGMEHGWDIAYMGLVESAVPLVTVEKSFAIKLSGYKKEISLEQATQLRDELSELLND